jgi:lysophospholipase L1-like esterase
MPLDPAYKAGLARHETGQVSYALDCKQLYSYVIIQVLFYHLFFACTATTMKTITILCIGDSHTAGFPDYDPFMGGDPESSYQYWLNRELSKTQPAADYLLINEGACGDTSAGIVHRLQQALKTRGYDLVILAGGTNDLGLTNGDQVFYNLKQGYEACMKHSIPVIAPSIPPISFAEIVPQVIALNNAIQSYASLKHHILFADWFTALQDDRGFLADIYNSGDGIHLSVAGYKCIGQLLAPLVKRTITI